MKGLRKAIALAILPIVMLASIGVTSPAEYGQVGAAVTDEVGDGVRVSSRLWELLFGDDAVPAAADEEVRLIVGGDVFGARIYQGYVSVCEDSDQLGIKAGDVIETINGVRISAVRDARGVIELGGGEHAVTLSRGSKRVEIRLTGEEGRRLLALLRDGAAGIGTVTYIDPTDMSFGGLGHGICDDTGATVSACEGVVTGVIIGGVQRGERGQPGELAGILTDRLSGRITANTPCGVFGVLDGVATDKSAAIPIARREEVKEGAASIVCTVKNGKRAEYAVELFDLHPGETGTKCFKLRVTDKALLALTGGIVRGMSGSPIIQDGKLVGAVTHVMVANPTEGYGIFIENMLNAAQSEAMPKAA